MIYTTQALTAEQMEEQLDRFLDSVLTSRRTATGLAKMLAVCNRQQQDFILEWMRMIRQSTHAEMAYQFASHATRALDLMDEEGVAAWAVHAMDVYDKKGLHPAIAILSEVDTFIQTQKVTGLPLEDILGILQLYIAGLSGRPLKIESSEIVYTDTETLFLPPLLNRFTARTDNFCLYKAMAVHLWAQTYFGTWRQSVSKVIQHYEQPEKALQLFHTLERLRLEACIARELPGLYRDINQLLTLANETRIPSDWEGVAEHLAQPKTTVQDSYDLLPRVYAGKIPPSLCYQGVLQPERVEEVIAIRLAREKELFRIGLVHLAKEKLQLKELTEIIPEGITARFNLEQIPDETQLNGFTFELHIDGIPIIPPDNLKSVIDSIIQDIGMIPEEYLVAAGEGGYKIPDEKVTERDPADVWKGVYHEEGAFLYDEWDYQRRHYRKHWCVLRELEVHPQPESFVIKTLQHYRGLVKTIQRTFEAIRGENKRLKAQPNGDEVDLDALIRAYADTKYGLEMTNRLFTKFRKEERSIAVMFMVDMSGSTKGWINNAEREALILLCEALEILGDRYAIYGFSGMTRKRCEIYRVKQFTEPYNNLVQQRISGITPRDYTRMGVAIRHLTTLIKAVEAKNKILITLSDGKPDDYGDKYRGTYGIEDTRQALIEAKREGIHPFCITLDTEAKDYLPHMYGVVNYIVIDEVRKLPLKVSEIYRKITS